MAVESVKAFCVRMMSDEDFRNELGKAQDAAAISAIISKEYSFTREEFLKGIAEIAGKKVPMEELKQMIYEEDILPESSAKAVGDWLDALV